MPRNPDKVPIYVQLETEEAELMMAQFKKKQWSKSKIIRKIVRWWLGEKGLLPKTEIP